MDAEDSDNEGATQAYIQTFYLLDLVALVRWGKKWRMIEMHKGHNQNC